MATVPDPQYDYAINRLSNAYKVAVSDILAELQRLDVSDISRANSAAALSEVLRILAALNAESAKWAGENIPQAARDGVVRTILSLSVVDTVADAEKIAKFNRINSNMVASAVADTQADLLAVTQNVDRKVRAAVRKVTADSMRANMAAGINGRRTIRRDILDGLRKTLGDAVNTGIIDARGRRWKPEVYAEMVTRTKMMTTHMEATANEAIARGALFGVVSRHGATDGCAKYEGKVVKLTPEADGDYPYVGDLRASGAIFHPNCKHVINPIRKPSMVSDMLESPFSGSRSGSTSDGENYPVGQESNYNGMHGMSERTDSKIRENEKELRSLKYERGIIFDSNGNKIWENSGSERKLDIREAAEKGLLSGNIITHNHPDNYSFSRADVGILFHYGIKEMRATSGEYLHRISIGDSQTTVRNVLEAYSDIRDAYEPLLRAEIKSGRIGVQEGNITLYHEVVKRLAMQFNFNYTRERL